MSRRTRARRPAWRRQRAREGAAAVHVAPIATAAAAQRLAALLREDEARFRWDNDTQGFRLTGSSGTVYYLDGDGPPAGPL